MKKPNFFIVGAPKCGTSSLYNLLKANPDIFMSDVKELNFFSTDIQSPDFIRSEKEYYSLFDGSDNYMLIGEASVWHLYSKVAAEKIYDFNSSAKIIMMIRNPVDMVYSYHGQRLFNGTEDIENFQKALDAIEGRKKGKLLPKNPYPIEGLFYLDIAKYYEQIMRYINKFGRDNVHIIVFDDYKKDSLAIYQGVLKFLGLPEHSVDTVSQDKFARNPSKRYKNRWVKKLIQKPPAFIMSLGKILVPNDELRRKIWRRFKIMNIEWKPRDPLSPELRKILIDYYMSEVKQLSKLLERDLVELWFNPSS